VFSTIVGSLPGVAVAIFVWRATASQARANVEMADVMREDFENRERPYLHVSEIGATADQLRNAIATKLEIRNVGPMSAVDTSIAASYNKSAAEQRNPSFKRVAIFPSEQYSATFYIRWEGTLPVFDPRLEITIAMNYTRLGKDAHQQYSTEHVFRVDFHAQGEVTAIYWALISTDGV
jgi:hypothetical protein